VERLHSSIHTSFALRDYFPVSSFVILPRTLTEFLFVPLTGKRRTMSEKGQVRKSMFSVHGAPSLTLSRYRQARSNVSCTASSASGVSILRQGKRRAGSKISGR
jgi:hypothetical protein